MSLAQILKRKAQRISKEQQAPQQHLLSTRSIETLKLSVTSFKNAVTSPYVFEKLKRQAPNSGALHIVKSGSLAQVCKI